MSSREKDLDLLRLVRGSVPVAEAADGAPAWVEGITFAELRASGDAAAIEQAAQSAGEALAAIHRFTFDRPGWIGPGLVVQDGPGSLPDFIEERAPAELRERIGRVVRAAAGDYERLSHEAHLCHGDFNGHNLIVRCNRGRWRVAAVIDWEFAVSSSPLMDIGNFLRHGDVPGFLEGYRSAGGVLPPDWPRLARLLDMAALVQLASQGRKDAVDLLAALV